MAKKDYYVILGVPRSESSLGIREAFRKLAKKYHPDLSGPETAERFREIAHAYEVLSDPEQRRTYDQTLRREENSPRPEAFRPVRRSQRYKAEPLIPNAKPVFSHFHGAWPSVEPLFQHLVRNFTEMQMPMAEGERVNSLDFDLVLSPREAAHGVNAPIRLPIRVACSLCQGSGRDWLFPCMACSGQGEIEQEVTVSLRVPPMVRDHTVIEVPIEWPTLRYCSLRLHIRISP